MKHCNSCDQDLKDSKFGRDKHSKTGLTDYCKECRNRNARNRIAVVGRPNRSEESKITRLE